MTLDIRGSLKNTRKSKNTLVVIDELLSNSIDAFLIRQNETRNDLALEVSLSVRAVQSDLLDQEYDLEIQCADNGCGLGPDQLKAFLTKDTSYKDDLNIIGIGNCKGSGRVQFFHHFSKISMSSTYYDGEDKVQVYLPPVEQRKAIEQGDFTVKPVRSGSIGTNLFLAGVLPKIRETIFTVDNVNELMNADALKQYVLSSLLQRFVSLKDTLGDFRISFHSDLAGDITSSDLKPSDIPKHSFKTSVEVKHVEGADRISTNLSITHYKLNENAHPIPRNIVGLCAKSAIVEDITRNYLRPTTLVDNAIDGFFHIILVEGEILDEGVNEQRDGFDKIPTDNGTADLFLGMQISFEDIYAVLDLKVLELLTPPDWSRDKIVANASADFGISEEMLAHSNTRVNFGDTPSSVAKRVLKNLQDKTVDETADFVSMKETISKLEPDSDDFRKKVDDLSWKVTSSFKTLDMANLSQLVVRRSIIIDMLQLAVDENLNIQTNLPEGKRRKNEALIHNIFFPMRKDSLEITDHDVWLLSEEYHYFDYIASDKPLKNVQWSDDAPLFESDIDEEVARLMTKNFKDNDGLRPDIALFHEEGSVVIVEFKAPDVSIDDHIGDLMEYTQLLAAKSQGRLKKFYGYLVGDTINHNRLQGYSPLTGAKGYFSTNPIIEPTSRAHLGELYTELLFYNDIVERARKRIGVYRDKLGLKN